MRGGIRPGAGRKKTGKRSAVFWVTDAEEKELRTCLEKLRSKEAESKAQSYEAVLESMGQTTVFDFVPQEGKTKAVKNKPKKKTDDAFSAWKADLDRTVRNALKKSKKQASLVLAEALCAAMNEKILTGTDAAADMVSYAADCIPKVVDARKKIETGDVEGRLEHFMFTLGYIFTFDEEHARKLWHKSPLL